MTAHPDHIPAHVKNSYPTCPPVRRAARPTPLPETEHFPAHVKSNYSTCHGHPRGVTPTPAPGIGA
ncbi:hypothetical protein O7606_04015 [Micromonospora sp. WMMD882]|uniref:hypothetical protein n=1 Tax=Micromonospora sp. WMMD882 TaxID=3015151 RepID=UPI00248C13B2|nr:hypothetical protein [Micromonospora sp. WMMD882]WBB80563.1 hypothetical protein O7606_04015 [Micromonospora sp. WMMD882]